MTPSYKLVPVEPTEAMYEGRGQTGSTFDAYLPFRDFVWCYRNALAVSPAPPLGAASEAVAWIGPNEIGWLHRNPMSTAVVWGAQRDDHSSIPLYASPPVSGLREALDLHKIAMEVRFSLLVKHFNGKLTEDEIDAVGQTLEHSLRAALSQGQSEPEVKS